MSTAAYALESKDPLAFLQELYNIRYNSIYIYINMQ